MLNPVYKCHDIFKVELNKKKKMCMNIATFCMSDKLFNAYNQFSTVAISTQTNKNFF